MGLVRVRPRRRNDQRRRERFRGAAARSDRRIYHHTSEKHLHRYIDEFAFRLNDANVARHTLDRLDSFTDGTDGKRLTYKALIE